MDESLILIKNKENEIHNAFNIKNELNLDKNSHQDDMTEKINKNLFIHKKQISEMTKVDINQVEAEIKQRDEEINEKELMKKTKIQIFGLTNLINQLFGDHSLHYQEK